MLDACKRLSEVVDFVRERQEKREDETGEEVDGCEDACDTIAAMLGAPNWEYAGQVIRDVDMLLERAQAWRMLALAYRHRNHETLIAIYSNRLRQLGELNEKDEEGKLYVRTEGTCLNCARNNNGHVCGDASCRLGFVEWGGKK